ncbi:MAG: DUF368 domain-containing protein [Nitriliruptoraceae bacterium]
MGVNSPHTPRTLTRVALTGSAMGLAELVPGFSAGTVAYVAGLYQQLLALIAAGLRLPVALVRGQIKPAWRAIDLPFALTLASAMLITVFAAAGLMRQLLTSAPQLMSAVFFGLVLGAAVASARQIGSIARADLAGMLLLGGVVFAVLGVSRSDTTAPSLWFVLFAGVIAICAWILPGVSGSFMLVVLGIYPVIVGAVADRDVATLGVFAIGCLIGVASIVHLLMRLLERHDRYVRMVLIAIMLGSVRVLWPWSDTFASSDLRAPDSVGQLAFLLLVAVVSGVAVVWVAASPPEPDNV